VEFGFVAALEREVSGLVRNWSRTGIGIAGVQRRICCSRNAALICAGTGVEQAYAAAKVLVEKCSPGMILSIGFAGSCIPGLRPGAVVVPATVLDAAEGKTFRCAFGSGCLVTLDRVAGKALKQESAARLGALAIDMEATGVAAAAFECGREFAAIKAVSDGADEDLSFLSGFVTPEGFEALRFIAHLAFRPRLWPGVAALNRNSKLAAAALQSAVAECMNDGRKFSAKHSPAGAEVQ
jgi:nucleoside phosphorylase